MELGVTRFLGLDAEEGSDKAQGFATFRRRLDELMAEFVAGRGANHAVLAALYNELWPDGVQVELARKPDGSFTATFDNGARMVFADWEELGAALSLMREKSLFGRVRRERGTA